MYIDINMLHIQFPFFVLYILTDADEIKLSRRVFTSELLGKISAHCYYDTAVEINTVVHRKHDSKFFAITFQILTDFNNFCTKLTGNELCISKY